MRTLYIVTYFKSANYGSRLQAYALAQFIGRLGYDVRMMGEFKVASSFIRHPKLLLARLYNRLHGRRRREFYQPSTYLPSAERQARLDTCLTECFSEESFLDSRSWRKAVAQKPIFVVGSDIVWNPMQGFPSKYYLDFAIAEGLPCFSYSPSIGAQEIPRIYHGAIHRLLSHYSCVGVRENDAVRLLEPIAGRSIQRNIDPTLLLSADDWDQFAALAKISVPIAEDGFIICYFVMDDRRYWDYVQRVAESTDLQVIVLPMHYNDEQQPYKCVMDATPYEFVWLIKHAEMIVTDSFHACAFSLQYEKEFYLLRRTRKAEDSKYDDFLARYGLENRMVTDESTFVRLTETDYATAYARLEEDRELSMGFLNEALRLAEQYGEQDAG